MNLYIHERRDWPRFRWNNGRLAGRLAAVRHQQGRLIGRMEALGFSVSAEAVLHTLTRDWSGSWAGLSRALDGVEDTIVQEYVFPFS